MKTILMILHLSNGEVAKVPLTIITTQTCNDKLVEIIKPKDSDEGIYFNGHRIWANYCQTGDGRWIQ